MWDSVETLSKINNLVQIALILFAVLSYVLGMRISALEQIEGDKNKEIISKLENQVKRESKKALPVLSGDGETLYMKLEIPPDNDSQV